MTLVENVLKNTCSISEICQRITPTLTPDEEYDLVVIEGGSAGATVSEWKVLLLEVGTDKPVASQVSMSYWNYKTEPEKKWRCFLA